MRQARATSSSPSPTGRADRLVGRRTERHGAEMGRELYRAIVDGILYGGVYALMAVGPDYVQLNASYVTSSVHVLGFYLPYIYLYGFGLAVALVAALYLMLYRTTFGRSLRATMQDQTAARLVGIDINRVAALAFG